MAHVSLHALQVPLERETLIDDLSLSPDSHILKPRLGHCCIYFCVLIGTRIANLQEYK